jgi:signal transduction histidine kinase
MPDTRPLPPPVPAVVETSDADLSVPLADQQEAPRARKRRPWRSVRWRITIVATALVGITLAVAAYVLVTAVERQLTDRAREDASTALDATAGELEAGQSIEQITGYLPGGPYLQVFGPDGQEISPNGREGAQLFALDANHHLVPVRGLRASRFAVVTRTVVKPEGSYTVVAASPLEEVRRSVQTLASSLWIGIPLLVLLVGVVTWWLVGRALHPVERMRQEVEEIRHTTLHRRIDEPATDDEVARLAHTMNDMLDRLDAAQQRQRQFVSDASHELRSPLATIRTTVEVASLHPQRADWPAVATTVLGESERLDELVADLLALAKLDETGNRGSPRRVQPVDLDDLVLTDVARLRALGYVMRAEGVSAARVEGDPSQLARLVRNLLDNAARHAASVVIVTLSEDGGQAVLRVDDDGPGIAPEDRERIFERFTRGDEGRARHQGGAGLGLSLVKAIALAHGGTVTAADAPAGGARFEVRLPLAATV